MKEEERIQQLLQSALNRHRTPPFLQIRTRAEAPAAVAEGVTARKKISPRNAFAGSFFALLAVSFLLGLVGLQMGRYPSAYPLQEASSDAAASSQVVISQAISSQPSSTGAVWFNILPASSVDPYVNRALEQIKSLDRRESCSAPNALSLNPESDDLPEEYISGFLGEELVHRIEKEPDSTYDVVVDISAADQNSEFVKQLRAQSLLDNLMGDNYFYVKLTEQQVRQCAQEQVFAYLVGQGKPVRPQGYPDQLDDGAAWVFDQSGADQQVSVVFTSLLSDSSSYWEEERAQRSLENNFLYVGVADTDYLYLDTQSGEALRYVVYLTKGQMLWMISKNPNCLISPILDPNSENPYQEQYYEMMCGDGWIFSS